jgi:DnaJ-class molecular chaperone
MTTDGEGEDLGLPPLDVPCQSCDGTGKDYGDHECRCCEGRGHVATAAGWAILDFLDRHLRVRISTGRE